jgi:hypothetical protein
MAQSSTEIFEFCGVSRKRTHVIFLIYMFELWKPAQLAQINFQEGIDKDLKGDVILSGAISFLD